MLELGHRRWRIVAFGIAACTVIGAVEAVQVQFAMRAIGRDPSWARSVSGTMPSWFALGAAIPLIVALANRFPLDAARWRRSVGVHFAAAVAFSAIYILIVSWLSDVVFMPGTLSEPFMTNFGRLFANYFMYKILVYWAVVGAYHAVIYRHRLTAEERDRAQLELRTTRLEASLTQANLDSLRMQLNPHFLFNTLNTVSVLALKGERHRVVRTLALLSDLLRSALDNTEQVISLREELEFLDRYIEIEQIRFGDRLKVTRDIDDAALDAEVPSLLLQPMVENAIRHGIAKRPGTGSVELYARRVGNMLELRVADSGPGFTASRSNDGGHGVGVGNTRARLQQLYGASAQLELTNANGGGALVTIRMPYTATTDGVVHAAGSTIRSA